MKTFLFIFVVVMLHVGGALTLLLVARVLAAPFSRKVREQISRHPRWHLVWFGLVAVFAAAIFIVPEMIEKSQRKARLQQLRESTAQRIQDGGGWDAFRAECLRFAAERLPEHKGSWRGLGEVTNRWPILNSLNLRLVDVSQTNTGETNVAITIGSLSRKARFILVVTSSDCLELPAKPGLSVLASGRVRGLTNGVFEVIRGY